MGYAGLWLVAALYRRVRGREGLGGGDPKLLGAIGAWLGWAALPLILLGASLLGLGLVLLDRLRGRAVAGDTMVPLGALMAGVAWPLWLLLLVGGLDRLVM
jgi:leader peptidase (prepilin peptidase)/N-methyltransferase